MTRKVPFLSPPRTSLTTAMGEAMKAEVRPRHAMPSVAANALKPLIGLLCILRKARWSRDAGGSEAPPTQRMLGESGGERAEAIGRRDEAVTQLIPPH
jgi:hypothetical protein